MDTNLYHQQHHFILCYFDFHPGPSTTMTRPFPIHRQSEMAKGNIGSQNGSKQLFSRLGETDVICSSASDSEISWASFA